MSRKDKMLKIENANELHILLRERTTVRYELTNGYDATGVPAKVTVDLDVADVVRAILVHLNLEIKYMGDEQYKATVKEDR
jgi:hypothetical protein